MRMSALPMRRQLRTETEMRRAGIIETAKAEAGAAVSLVKLGKRASMAGKVAAGAVTLLLVIREEMKDREPDPLKVDRVRQEAEASGRRIYRQLSRALMTRGDQISQRIEDLKRTRSTKKRS